MKKDRSEASKLAEKIKAAMKEPGAMAEAIAELKAEEAERMKGHPEAPPTIFPIND